jgi:hypothetical protein
MTAQINDRVYHRNKHYAIAGVSGSGLFDPAGYGVTPGAISSACWRGFHVDYTVRNAVLTVTSLTIGLSDSDRVLAAGGGLPFAPGIKPVSAEFGGERLEKLSLPVPYTGGLLLAEGFIQKLYVHMGFHPAWKYRDVRELIFEQGRLLEDHDRTTAMAELREKLAAKPLRPDITREGDVMAWIEKCFSRDYNK